MSMPAEKKESAVEFSFLRGYFVNRFLAKFIDLLIMAAFFAFPSFVGPLAGLTYILIADGFWGGQSIGKKLIGVKVTTTAGKPCDFKSSIIRNSVFGALVVWYMVIHWIPYIGALLAVIAWVVVVAFESMLIFSDPDHARFGDRIARTRVAVRVT